MLPFAISRWLPLPFIVCRRFSFYFPNRITRQRKPTESTCGAARRIQMCRRVCVCVGVCVPAANRVARRGPSGPIRGGGGGWWWGSRASRSQPPCLENLGPRQARSPGQSHIPWRIVFFFLSFVVCLLASPCRLPSS